MVGGGDSAKFKISISTISGVSKKSIKTNGKRISKDAISVFSNEAGLTKSSLS